MANLKDLKVLGVAAMTLSPRLYQPTSQEKFLLKTFKRLSEKN